MPNVKVMAKAEARGTSSCEQQLIDYAEVCVTPAYDYFKARFDHDLKPALWLSNLLSSFLPRRSITSDHLPVTSMP